MLHPVPQKTQIPSSSLTNTSSQPPSQSFAETILLTVLVPRFQMRDFSIGSVFLFQFSISKKKKKIPLSIALSSSSHHNWKEVCSRVLPAGFLALERPPMDIQAHEHLPLFVPPLGRRIGVVAVLLDPLLQGAVNAKLLLETQQESHFSVNVSVPPTCEECSIVMRCS